MVRVALRLGACSEGSRLLLFEFRPPRVQRIHEFLCFVQLGASVLQADSIAGDGRIFERGMPGLKVLFRFMDAVFDGSEFPSFDIGELFFSGATPGFSSTPPPPPLS